MRRGWGRRLYRLRGWVPVLPIAAALAFARPRPGLVLAGLALMALGEGIRTWSAAHLGATVRSSSPRAAKLVTTGPYARTRHPIYWGNFALTVGFTLASGAGFPWFPFLAAAGFVALYARHAREEERALASAFSEAHAAYRARVPAWRWRVRPARVPGAGATSDPSFRRAVRVELGTWHAELWLVAGLWLRTRWPTGG